MSRKETGNQTGFLKRRFSLTHEANDLIDELAESQHGGNRSAAVRAAIYAQVQRRDEDEIRHGLKRLQKEIQSLTDEIEALQDPAEQHSQLTGGAQPENNTVGATSSLTPTQSEQESGSGSDERAAREVYAIIRTVDQDACTLEELVAEVDFSLSTVAAGIDVLVAKGAIEEISSDDKLEFRLTDS